MNTYFYSPETQGLYSSAISGDNLPSDAIALSKDEWARLRDGLHAQKVVVIGADGRPELAEKPPHVRSRDEIQNDRLLAYAHPLTGSDRFFASASSMSATGATQKEIDEAIAQGKARYEEIKAQYPWSAD